MKLTKFFDWNKDGLRKPNKVKETIVKDPDWIQLSTLQILKIWALDKMLGQKDLAKEYAAFRAEQEKLKHASNPNHNPKPENVVEVYHLAVTLDDEVYEVMRAQKELADILLANPKFVLFSPEQSNVQKGMWYIKGEFVDDPGKQEEK